MPALVVRSAGLKHGDGLLKTGARYNLTDLRKVTAEGELPYGSAEGALGMRTALRRSW